MLDALADGGVYAGIPKEMGLRLIAHTMIVSEHLKFELTYECTRYPVLYLVVWGGTRLEKVITDTMGISSLTQTHRVLQGWF